MNRARGESSIREAEQEAQKEEQVNETNAATPGLACLDSAQANPFPFGETTGNQVTPDPTVEPSIKEPGDSQMMDLK